MIVCHFSFESSHGGNIVEHTFEEILSSCHLDGTTSGRLTSSKGFDEWCSSLSFLSFLVLIGHRGILPTRFSLCETILVGRGLESCGVGR